MQKNFVVLSKSSRRHLKITKSEALAMEEQLEHTKKHLKDNFGKIFRKGHHGTGKTEKDILDVLQEQSTSSQPRSEENEQEIDQMKYEQPVELTKKLMKGHIGATLRKNPPAYQKIEEELKQAQHEVKDFNQQSSPAWMVRLDAYGISYWVMIVAIAIFLVLTAITLIAMVIGYFTG